jgi:putative DNA methylase
MSQAKKLMEVSIPIKEISAESVRDKSIRHGHISTLHLWWARRPLPVCRAVVFASLVPDPLDPLCPTAFRNAVEILLGKAAHHNRYAPYADIPWTSVFDPMDDNLRNRLQMFIGKFSDDMQHALLLHKEPPPAAKLLSDASLIKWDNKNKEPILNIARQLIWVAHNAPSGRDAQTLLNDFDHHFKAIQAAQQDLHALQDRHLPLTDGVSAKERVLQRAIDAFLDQMPKVFDPFAGGGAIPLEAARLGCRSFGNDINPVAHIIQKGSLEFPQRFGKPIRYSKAAFIARFGADAWQRLPNEDKSVVNGETIAVTVQNRLAFDVAFFAQKLLARTEAAIGHFYPADPNGQKPIAYYWARVGTCSNPSCQAEVPLLKQFYLANTKNKQVFLQPSIQGNRIEFKIAYGNCKVEPFMTKSLKCRYAELTQS